MRRTNFVPMMRIMIPYRRWVFRILVSVFFCVQWALAEEQIPGFHSFEIEGHGAIQHVFAGDFDGDSLTDLCLVICRSDASEPIRQLQLFYQQRNGLRKHCDACLNLPSSAIGVDFDDINGNNIDEIILLMQNGLFQWQPSACDSSQLIPLVGEQYSLYAAHPTILFHIPFILKDKNNAQLLWATVEENKCYRQEGDKFILSRVLPRMMDHKFVHEAMVYPVPSMVFSKNSDDLDSDIWQYSGDMITAFSPDEESPAFVWQAASSFEDRSIQPLQSSKLKIELIDLNHDDRQDVVVTQAVRGGVASHISHMQFYHNTSGRLAETPEQVVLTDNVHGEHVFCDLNHDDYPDLLVFELNVTFPQAIRFLLTGKVTVGFDVYMNQSGLFPSKPDQTIRWHLPVSLDEMILAPYDGFSVEGDLNGDGHQDLFAKIDDDIYMMVPGSETGFLNMDQKTYYHFPGQSQFVLKDFNHDNSDDILFYTSNDASHNHVIIYLSQ